jgi:hypothetical protein
MTNLLPEGATLFGSLFASDSAMIRFLPSTKMTRVSHLFGPPVLIFDVGGVLIRSVGIIIRGHEALTVDVDIK